MAPELIDVQVCYATPERVWLLDLRVAPGTTIAQALTQSGVLLELPEIDLATQALGLFGKKRAPDTVLRARDRIEIYRPLVADPKESRRKKMLDVGRR